MIVKQVSIDVEINDSNEDLERIMVEFLESKGYFIYGSNQEDMSGFYNKQYKTEQEEMDICED